MQEQPGTDHYFLPTPSSHDTNMPGPLEFLHCTVCSQFAMHVVVVGREEKPLETAAGAAAGPVDEILGPGFCVTTKSGLELPECPFFHLESAVLPSEGAVLGSTGEPAKLISSTPTRCSFFTSLTTGRRMLWPPALDLSYQNNKQTKYFGGGVVVCFVELCCNNNLSSKSRVFLLILTFLVTSSKNSET